MKKITLTLLAAIAGIFVSVSAQELPGDLGKPSEGNTISASSAFVSMPARTLQLLNRSARLDMLDWYHADSIADVFNLMEGMSHLYRPVTNDYLKVQITPVSTLEIRVLPSNKGSVVATSYTLGDSLQSADSDIRFYSDMMTELKRDKYLKLAQPEDFFDFTGVSKSERKELLDLIPFPTVEYKLSPDSDTLLATFTVGEYLSQEDMARLKPYLRREREYHWNGKKYEMTKPKPQSSL